MDKHNKIVNNKFTNIYKRITEESFLQQEGLGGEVPFFVTSYPPEAQTYVDSQIEHLILKLKKNGYEVLEINLYALSLEILEEKKKLKRVLKAEKRLNKGDLQMDLNSLLDAETAIAPAIKKRTETLEYDMIFLTGIGLIYPFVNSSKLLNNLQSVIKAKPLISFFPGHYTGYFLELFNRFRDNNYYRAFNLDIIK